MLAVARMADAPEGEVHDLSQIPPRSPRSQTLRLRHRLRAAQRREQAKQQRTAEAFAQGWAQQSERKAQQAAALAKRDRWTLITAAVAIAVAGMLVVGILRAERGRGQGEQATTQNGAR